MKQSAFLHVCLFLAFLLSGCGRDATPDGLAIPSPESTILPTSTIQNQGVGISSIEADRYPRVDGSTSTYPLQFMVGCHVLNVSCSWSQGDEFDPTRRIVPDMVSMESKKS